MQPIPFEIQRDTEKLTITVTPGVNPETGKPFIGVVSSLKNVRLTPVQAAVAVPYGDRKNQSGVFRTGGSGKDGRRSGP